MLIYLSLAQQCQGTTLGCNRCATIFSNNPIWSPKWKWTTYENIAKLCQTEKRQPIIGPWSKSQHPANSSWMKWPCCKALRPWKPWGGWHMTFSTESVSQAALCSQGANASCHDFGMDVEGFQFGLPAGDNELITQPRSDHGQYMSIYIYISISMTWFALTTRTTAWHPHTH